MTQAKFIVAIMEERLGRMPSIGNDEGYLQCVYFEDSWLSSEKCYEYTLLGNLGDPAEDLKGWRSRRLM